MSTINKQQLGSPGPGNYLSSNSGLTRAKSPTIKFGTTRRPDNFTKKDDQPGPGNY